MVNDQMVELRSTLSDLQDQETQLKAQYELSYDLQDTSGSCSPAAR